MLLRALRRLTGRALPETLIPEPYLSQLGALLRDAMSRCGGGDAIEIGVYRGGSLYRLGEVMAAQGQGARRLIGIDTFEGHPYSDPKLDPAHHPKGRFADTSYEAVAKAMARFPFADVRKGECGEVFLKLPADQTFCFAHVDVDVCEASVACMEYVFPRLKPGGMMVFDEYAGYGQQAFIDAYFAKQSARLERRTGRDKDDYGLIVWK